MIKAEKPAPLLDQYELQSPVWKKIEAHLKAELAERREYNDGHSLTDIETATIRGEIKHIKKLLRLSEALKAETPE